MKHIKIVSTNIKGQVVLIGTFTSRLEAETTLKQIADGNVKIPPDTVSLFILDSSNPPVYFSVNGMLSIIVFDTHNPAGSAKYVLTHVKDQSETSYTKMHLDYNKIPEDVLNIFEGKDNLYFTVLNTKYPNAINMLRQSSVIEPPSNAIVIGGVVYSIHLFNNEGRFI